MAIKKVRPDGTDGRFPTALQETFIDFFIGEAELNVSEACRMTREETGKLIKPKEALASEAVQRAIHLRLNTTTKWINEGLIIDRLFKEGTTANSASARVNALVWVGKHLGMWTDKAEEKEKTVYNIVNYSTPKENMTKTIEAKEITEKEVVGVELPQGVSLTTYSKDQEKIH